MFILNYLFNLIFFFSIILLPNKYLDIKAITTKISNKCIKAPKPNRKKPITQKANKIFAEICKNCVAILFNFITKVIR